MQRALHLTAAAIAVLASAASAEELVVYSAHGPDIRDEFVSAFSEAHPGIAVTWLDMGAAEILTRIRAEGNHPRAQVWWGAPATFFILAGDEGLLEPYRPSWAEAVPDYARGEGDLWYGQFDLPLGIGYVPGRIPDEHLPRTWDELAKPGSPGRLILRDPPASGTMKTFLAAMIDRQPDVEAGLDWLARLDSRTDGYTASPDLLFQKLARGEGDLTVWNVTDLLFQRAAHKYPFAVILPKEGVPVITDSIALVKGAGDAARAFYEFVTTVDANVALAERHYRLPTRRDLPEDSMPLWSKGLIYRVQDIDRARLVAEMEGWIARWEGEVRGGKRRKGDQAPSEGPVTWLPFVAAAVLVALVVSLVGRRRKREHEDV